MAFLDRRSGRPGRHLEWRVRLMGAGAILALVGMYYDAGWMVWIAIGVLLLGFFLRFLPGSDEGAPDDDDEGPGG